MIERILDNPVLRDAAKAVAAGKTVRMSGLWGSSMAMAAAGLGRLRKSPILLVVAHLDDADQAADDIEVLTGRPAQLFPAWEVDIAAQNFKSTLGGSASTDDLSGPAVNDEVAGERLRLCNLLATRKERGMEGGADASPARRTTRGQGVRDTRGQDASAMNNALATEESLDVIVAPVMALLQRVPAPEALAASRLTLKRSARMEPDELAGWLVESGFENVEQVDQQGEFARRGGIIDIFPPASALAVRVEFFGDQIDSIRRFDLDTQRSTDEMDSFSLTGYAAGGAKESTHLLSYLPADTIVCLSQPSEVMDLAQEIYRRTGESDAISGSHARTGTLTRGSAGTFPLKGEASLARSMLQPEEVFAAVANFALVELHVFAPREQDAASFEPQASATANRRPESIELDSSRALPSFNLGVRSLERLSINTTEALAELEELSEAAEVWVYCENPAEQKRFGELLGQSHPRLAPRVKSGIGHVSGGFHWPAQKLVIVGHHEVFHRYAKVRRIRRIRAGRPIESLLDLCESDYVVHVAHGIARFEGLRKMERDGRSEEYLTLRFADNALLHVPAGSINLVQKYIGTPAHKPALSRLGGAGWLRAKQRVSAAVTDLAAEMLRVQAMRRASPGVSYPTDTELQRQFADEFLYSETEDQITSMRQIEADMREPRPMDRLLCGDVGYGKTELAMRAAFKAVEAGKQVAVLVPTTVLADQHYRTFSERLADYPVRVEALSRFRSPREQKDILKRLAGGQVDILIGTHRLLSRDVKFPDLGLVVIDEEQRFGVEDKEHLKSVRATVDVLTMTATPIPRTLHLSLLGLRDISALSTPPLDRRAIFTQVVQYDDQLVRSAILRELNRQGQVFFLHNRVMDIDSLAAHVQELVPEARVGVGHGQMREGKLEAVMLRLVRGEIDVLVCTTIIESGLDIPTANTILIHNADRFGLAELHQLRGRVGRYKHRAFCYLLLPEERTVTPAVARRLKAIEEFSDLGAGFQIAMRDLEIRGAGNILGKEQSGHIAAVGYELFCQLLEQAVRQMKGEAPPARREVHVELGVDSFIPISYVPAARQRMEIYRRLVHCSSGDELKQLSRDMADAYGKWPGEVGVLLDQAEIRVLAGQLGVESIIRMEPDIILRSPNARALAEVFDASVGSLRLADSQTAHWRPPKHYFRDLTFVNVLLERLRRARPNV